MFANILEKYGQRVNISEGEWEIKAFISRTNKRIRVMEYSGKNLEGIISRLDDLAQENKWVTKIFAKAKKTDVPKFIRRGYEVEGIIRKYFSGDDAVVVSRFLDPGRKYVNPEIAKDELKIMDNLRKTKGIGVYSPPPLPAGYRFTIAKNRAHFEDLANLYRQIYESYPFPIFEADYLEETAKSHIIYGLVYNSDGRLVAAASAEIDAEHKNAEMTDFATLPSERGRGLACIILKFLEEKIVERGISALYTIARSRSVGMNKVFKRAGYEYTGKLVNNCHICGSFENMSIWCKNLS